MNNFCTLFDSGYFSRGLLLYKSLMEFSPNSFLYIFAFDDIAYNELVKINLSNVKVIALKDFEDNELLDIKPTRSKGEYCWTCTPSIIKYCLENFELPQCTYLDADLYFFSNPEVLLKEMKDDSVLITEHRYTDQYDQTATSGKYCVQFMSFKNDEKGMKVLNWWRDRCIEWCYSRYENGKFGDQKYLDDWLNRFEGVHGLRHLGGGVAPWNLQQYDFSMNNGVVELTEKTTNSKYALVFFHFHALKILKNNFDLGIYKIDANTVKLIYQPYFNELVKVDLELKEKGLNFNWHAIGVMDNSLKSKFKLIKRKILGVCNIVASERTLHG